MNNIVAIFIDYDQSHPLWGVGSSEIKIKSPGMDFSTIDPDVIITDWIGIPLEIIKKYPTIFYITDQTYSDLKTTNELEKLPYFNSILAMSHKISSLANSQFNIQASVQLPYLANLHKSDPRFIYYDYGFKFASRLQSKFNREEFRHVGSIENLSTAKLYLCIPPKDCLWY